MDETIEKATLEDMVQSAYEQLNTLLATLSEEQKTTPGVNGSWSVKDTLAHITAWQDLLPARIQSWVTGHPPGEFLPEFKTEDEVNEYIYQQNKDRPLVEVEAAFHMLPPVPMQLSAKVNGQLLPSYFCISGRKDEPDHVTWRKNLPATRSPGRSHNFGSPLQRSRVSDRV